MTVNGIPAIGADELERIVLGDSAHKGTLTITVTECFPGEDQAEREHIAQVTSLASVREVVDFLVWRVESAAEGKRFRPVVAVIPGKVADTLEVFVRIEPRPVSGAVSKTRPWYMFWRRR